MLTGFGLAAFYILPAAWERNWVQISQVLTANLRPEQNFLFTHSSDRGISALQLEDLEHCTGNNARNERGSRVYGTSSPPVWQDLVDAARPGDRVGVGDVRRRRRCGGICRNSLSCNFRGDGLGRCRCAFAFFAAAAIGTVAERRSRRIAMVAD